MMVLKNTGLSFLLKLIVVISGLAFHVDSVGCSNRVISVTSETGQTPEI